jgi:hypothetical protein
MSRANDKQKQFFSPYFGQATIQSCSSIIERSLHPQFNHAYSQRSQVSMFCLTLVIKNTLLLTDINFDYVV